MKSECLRSRSSKKRRSNLNKNEEAQGKIGKLYQQKKEEIKNQM
jgi:hypothetical protein